MVASLLNLLHHLAVMVYRGRSNGVQMEDAS